MVDESAASGGVQKYFKKLVKMKPGKAEKLMKKSWSDLSTILKSRLLEDDAVKIINKHLGTKFRRLIEIDKAAIASLPSVRMNEDLKHYWDFIKGEAFPALSFYPALTAWMELDKLISSTGDFDGTKFGVYALFWVILLSSKFLNLWKKWKKNNPKEFEKEGSRRNPFAVGKK